LAHPDAAMATENRRGPIAAAPAPLLGLAEEELSALAQQAGEPAYRGRQLARWLYRRRVADPHAMSDLPRSFRSWLLARPTLPLPRLEQVVPSPDGARKLLFLLHDGQRVEGVLIPGRAGEATQCLSVQVGCPFDCAFCRTGGMGFVRNLSVAEILAQRLLADAALQPGEEVRRLVFMGMGEPLANLAELLAALRLLLGPQGMGFGPRRITVSTVGLPGRMLELRTRTGVQLAISLGGSSEEQRARLMPRASRSASLAEILAECRCIPLATTEQLTFELVLVAGVNDHDEDARRLLRWTTGLRGKVNLIPLNEHPGTELRAPAEERLLAFQRILVRGGRPTSIRRSRGRDSLAACGQLATDPTG